MKTLILTFTCFCIISIYSQNTNWNNNFVNQTDEQITAELISFWKLDEDINCTVFDTHSNNNGTLGPNCTTNAPLWVNGKINTALSFDGIDDYVTVPNANNLNPTTELSLSAWVKWAIDPITGNPWAQIINKNGDQQFQIQHNNNNTGFELAIKTNTGRKYIIGVVSPQQNIWHFVVGTYDGQEMRLYVDGILDVSANWTGNIVSSTSSLELGRRSVNNDRHFNGTIDEVRIWGRAITDIEVQALYNSSTLSLNKDNLQQIVFYPNPTKGLLKIQTANNQEEFSFNLYDVLGNQLKVSLSSNGINLFHLPAGVYLLEIISQNRRVIKRIIKE